MKLTIRITATNLDILHEGDVIEGAEDLGKVRSVRLTRNEFGGIWLCAKIYGESGQDFFGLPQTLTVIRD